MEAQGHAYIRANKIPPGMKFKSISIVAGLFLLVAWLPACQQEASIIKQERHVMNAGASLFVEAMGEGEPIIIVHGGPGLDHSYFLPYLEPLAKEYRLIFYDQRASGRSTAGDSAAFTMAQFVDDIDAIRKAFDYDTVHLMAHSWGGLLGMRYAIEYPERLRSLMLVNSNPASSALQETANARLQARITPADSVARMNIINTEGFRQRVPEALATYFRVAFKPSFYNRDQTDKLRFWFDDRYVENSVMLQGLGADASFRSFDLHPHLTSLSMPTLILHGVHDPVSRSEIEPMLEAIRGSRLIMIEESGHFPFIETQSAFNQHILDFLTDISE